MTHDAGTRRSGRRGLIPALPRAAWVVLAGDFAAAMVIFALGECLLSPTLPAIINDLAPDGAAGRYNGLGVLAFTTGFLLGPVSGGAALGAGWGAIVFAALAAACIAAAAGALRLGRHLPAAANHIPSLTPSGPAPAADPGPAHGQPPGREAPGRDEQPEITRGPADGPYRNHRTTVEPAARHALSPSGGSASAA